MTSVTLVAVVTTLLRLFRTDLVRERIFGAIGKLPKSLQWIAPALLAMLVAFADGWSEKGLTGQPLVDYALPLGGEVGLLAIGVWHAGKRLVECVLILWRYLASRGASSAVCLLLLVMAGIGNAGCNRNLIGAQIDNALLIEDKVFAQVDYLDSVFQALVDNPTMTPADKAMFRARFADSKGKLMQLMHAKDEALEAAKAANSEVINLREFAHEIVGVVQEIIKIVAMAGASPLLVQEQQTRAMGLARGVQ